MHTLGVSILIPTHNRSKILDRTLRSLSEMSFPPGLPVEIVVVANACTDDTEAVVAAWRGRMPAEVRCVPESNTGLGHARNRAVWSSTLPICALLDDDIWAARGWLESLVEVYSRTPASLVAGHIELWWESVERPPWLTPRIATTLSCLDLGPAIVELKTPDAIGANFSFRREVFNRVGPFRTDLDRIGGQLLGGGETAFVREALRSGLRLFYAPGVSVKHWVAPHRVEAPYLTSVARGTTFSIMRMREHLGPTDAARALSAGACRTAGHALLAALARISGNKGSLMRSLVYSAAGIGQWEGTIARLRHGPLRPAEPPQTSAPPAP